MPGPIYNMEAMDDVIALWKTWEHLLPEMMTQLTDVYMHHPAPISCVKAFNMAVTKIKNYWTCLKCKAARSEGMRQDYKLMPH